MGTPSAPELMIIAILFMPAIIGIIMHFRQAKVNLKNGTLDKEVPVGYSWISLIFGVFVPLVRGDIRWFLYYLVVTVLTSGIGIIILAFFYNKNYIQNLIEKGYFPANDPSKQLLVAKGIITSE